MQRSTSSSQPGCFGVNNEWNSRICLPANRVDGSRGLADLIVGKEPAIGIVERRTTEKPDARVSLSK
jgi:hypothetical protein